MVRVALDGMGGEEAPDAPLEAAMEALRDADRGLEILLVGDPELLEGRIRGVAGADGRLHLVPASEKIGMEEPPALAVRRKRESSIVVGIDLQREGKADAFVSAGSTGAVMAASVLGLRPLPGVDRPAVGAVVPTRETPVLVLDVGATVDCTPRNLHQFAHLGAIYLRDLLGVEEPRTGLLNVGEEEGKGGELATKAHARLRADPDLRFVGNVEGNRIIEGACDVLVCDGFTGNVLLKFYESIAGFIGHLLGKTVSGAGPDPEVEKILRILDYTEYGGAPLLGVDGVTVICHGGSPPRAIRNALDVAVRSVESGMVDDMREDLERLAERVEGRTGSPGGGGEA